MDWIARAASPLGPLTMASDGEALIGLWFDDQRHALAGLDAKHEARELPVFAQTRLWLEQYFAGLIPADPPRLSPRGTDFQARVWSLLREIPYGETRSYGELARLLSFPSARAIGSAVGQNPISLLIPCHRVLGANGSLTGYDGGLWRKEALLRLEGVLPGKRGSEEKA